MKLIKHMVVIPKKLNLTPNRIFRSKKDRSMVSRSDPSSFSSGSDDSSGSTHKNRPGATTPTSVLGPLRSGDWSSSDNSVSEPYLELLQAIKVIDRDNDGMVSRGELEALLSRLAPTREEVSTMVSEVVNEKEDGCISVEELTSRIGSACEQPAKGEELREVFLFFDTDRDGKITAEELFDFFTALGDDRCTLEECRRMIAAVDKNGDGFVCFEDFCRMMELQR